MKTSRFFHYKSLKSIKKMARVIGVEPTTCGVEARCSTIELHPYKSYFKASKINYLKHLKYHQLF